MTTIYRWRGAILMQNCTEGGSGDPYDRAIAVGPDCCCPECVQPCCCEDGYGNGVCLFEIRPPYCCTTRGCNETVEDPNIIATGYYQGGTTQIVNFVCRVYNGTANSTFNFPKNDYHLNSVLTQNQPSIMQFSFCTDKARNQIHLIAGCTFYIPVCVEGYIRDPYCVVEDKPRCDPCADVYDDCCGSTFDVIAQSQVVSTMANYLIVNECSGCAITPSLTCDPYPPLECRTGGTPAMYLFDWSGSCAGTITKKCCFHSTFTIQNNERFYRKDAYISTATLVGALQCDGTDNNGGDVPAQETFDCDYLTPYQ